MIELIGTLAAALTTVAFIPQAAKIFRERRTEGISVGMYFLFTTGVLLWLVYGALIGSRPLLLANAITLTLNVMILAMKLSLDRKRKRAALETVRS
ncbi:MAG TPA: SemiSWEET transporter [Planctomycetota bacterium]|nr:SemiSWEET transporter [Planctomycetota bacterium]